MSASHGSPSSVTPSLELAPIVAGAVLEAIGVPRERGIAALLVAQSVERGLACRSRLAISSVAA